MALELHNGHESACCLVTNATDPASQTESLGVSITSENRLLNPE